MKPWSERPQEEAYLLNPAFCCQALASAVRGYVTVESAGVPFPVLFMLLPITLHRATRESLPRSVSTGMADWLQSHPESRVQFCERVISLKSHTKEAVRFGLQTGWLEVGIKGCVQTLKNEQEIKKAVSSLTGDAKQCILSSKFVGRWIASAGTAETVLSLWGIKP